jgi:gamma-glutamylcyclotransferase (GGCT)/AIG2-like uncharacterized protein YtfP
MENSYLFVYGTLRPNSGHEMGIWFAQHAHYIGQATLRGQLYQVSYYPALVQGSDHVIGDIYACPSELWQRLDEFEEAVGDNAEYERHLTPVLLATGQWLSAWVYWYQRPTTSFQPVIGGDWLQHITSQ